LYRFLLLTHPKTQLTNRIELRRAGLRLLGADRLIGDGTVTDASLRLTSTTEKSGTAPPP